jgi:transcriptional regulator with XRE-family HTH domain
MHTQPPWPVGRILLRVSQKRSTKPRLLAFGQYLKDLRGERSQQQIARELARQDYPLKRSTLSFYENGRVWNPDWDALEGLAAVYRRPLEEVVGTLLANRNHPDATTPSDLPRHMAEGQLTPGGFHANTAVPAAHATVLELRAYDAAARLYSYANDLADLAAALLGLETPPSLEPEAERGADADAPLGPVDSCRGNEAK